VRWPPAPVLLLDEPVAGMNDAEAASSAQIFRKVWRDEGMAVLLIEHNMRFVMSPVHTVYVLDGGRLIAQGDARGGPRPGGG
jgi:branched-chain amino acid transport system ATP-binding protein